MNNHRTARLRIVNKMMTEKEGRAWYVWLTIQWRV